jgi:phage/plasmid-like protein (TIGR03299 family)
MAHNIEQFADGTSAFFSAREVAWHKLGVITDNALTAEDALKTAQLDSLVKVSEDSIYTKVDGKEIQLDKKFLTYRNHPKKGLTALGVVGSRYTPIQNLEAFEFLNHIADETGAVFETAGSLGNGERVFMTMKFPESMMIGGVDTIDNYIMAVNSHDGSSAFIVAVTPIRAVCTNTVRLALSQAKSKISLKHTAGATAKVQQARETLGVVFRYQDEFEKEVNQMLSIKITDKQYTEFVKTLVPEPKMKDPTDRMINSVDKKRGELMALWSAPTQQNVAGTAWAAYNAAVEWADWVKPIRSSKDDKDDLRSERMLLGGAEKFKARAQLLLTK